jgi:lysophospholipase L1-like esterase
MSGSKSRVARKVASGTLIALVLLGITELALRAFGYPPQSPFTYDPAIGMRYKPNERREMLYGGKAFAMLNTNEWGFRGPSFSREKAPGVVRVLCLGDSFTLGWGVDEPQTYPRLLQTRLDEACGAGRCEVLNLGQPDFNTVNELRMYREIGRTLAPDVVVLGYVLNDLQPETTLPSQDGSAFDRALRDSAIAQAVRRNFFPSLGVRQPAHAAENRERRKHYGIHHKEVLSEPDGEIGAPYWKVSLDALGELAAAVRADGVQFLLVVFPSRFQIGIGEPDLLAPQRRLERAAQELGIARLDLFPEFDQAGDPAYSEVDHEHPSALGYQLAAGRIAEELARLRFVPAVAGAR